MEITAAAAAAESAEGDDSSSYLMQRPSASARFDCPDLVPAWKGERTMLPFSMCFRSQFNDKEDTVTFRLDDA